MLVTQIFLTSLAATNSIIAHASGGLVHAILEVACCRVELKEANLLLHLNLSGSITASLELGHLHFWKRLQYVFFFFKLDCHFLRLLLQVPLNFALICYFLNLLLFVVEERQFSSHSRLFIIFGRRLARHDWEVGNHWLLPICFQIHTRSTVEWWTWKGGLVLYAHF